MKLPWVSSRYGRGASYAAAPAAPAVALTDEQKIENGDVGGGVPWIWLDANKINGSDDTGNPSDGGAVSSWASRTGSRTAVQSTGSAQPDWESGEINSLPVVDFATAEYLTVGSEEWTADNFSIFMVINWTSGYGFVSRWAYTSGERQFALRHNILYTSDNGTSTRTALSFTAEGSSYHVDSIIKDGTSYVMRRDLSAHASGTEANTNTLNDATQYTVIGGQLAEVDGGAFLGSTSELAELIIWDGTLSDTDRDLVEGYLKDKYDL